MKENILLTGGSGFIGKNLCEFLRGRGYSLFSPTSKELDLTDRGKMGDYLEKNNIDMVIHCASVRPTETNEYTILDGNLRMFFNLRSFAGRLRKLIYFGSGAEYGRYTLPPLVKEEYFGTVTPPDPYGFAKYVMRTAVASSENIYELCLFGVYGRHEMWERRFISNNIIRLLKGGPMTVHQNAMFDYLYIDDLCRIVEWSIGHAPRERHYNVCTSSPIALSDIAAIIRESSGTNCEIIVEKPGWQPEYSGDNTRLLREIGDFQFTDIRVGVEQLCRVGLRLKEP